MLSAREGNSGERDCVGVVVMFIRSCTFTILCVDVSVSLYSLISFVCFPLVLVIVVFVISFSISHAFMYLSVVVGGVAACFYLVYIAIGDKK